jgi:phosphoglycolate phosphatase-like HAD superfamily hydrolase
MFDSQKTSSSKNSLKNLRILLWDIDGTLMRSTVQDGYLKYFSATMRKVFGSAGTLSEIVPSGMTDTQIMYEALRGENFTTEQIFERKDELLKVFQAEMKTVLAEAGEPYEMLGGVREILAETANNPRFVNALLTGNLSVAAQTKLESVGLWHYFETSPNAFGEVSHDRRELAREAGKLFNERYDYNFKPEQFIVIGDTPNDIDCARAFGAKVVAVATGKNQSKEKLTEHAPDILIEDLTGTAEILRILENL